LTPQFLEISIRFAAICRDLPRFAAICPHFAPPIEILPLEGAKRGIGTGLMGVAIWQRGSSGTIIDNEGREPDFRMSLPSFADIAER